MGVVPSPDECISALQSHDLFIYFGHGSGKETAHISYAYQKCLKYILVAMLASSYLGLELI